MKIHKLIPCFLFCLPLCAEEESPSQLDLILTELAKLSEGLQRVEQRIDNLENQIVTASAEAIHSTGTTTAEGESGTFIDRVVEAVQIREERINFPWMDSALWATLEEGMTPGEVQAILGEPTLEDPSLHKRIDTVYTYRGRKPATGEKILGKVKLYKGQLVQIEAP